MKIEGMARVTHHLSGEAACVLLHIRLHRSPRSRKNRFGNNGFWFLALLFAMPPGMGYAQSDLPNIAPSSPEAVDTPSTESSLQPVSNTNSEQAQNDLDEQFRKAKPHIMRGEAMFGENNYDASLAEFEKAYQTLEGHPKQYQTLYNIGLCQERLFRYDLALQYYRRYLEQGGKQAENRHVVEATISALEGLLAVLSIEVNVPSKIWVDDRLIGEAPARISIPGGRHTLELRASGYESVQRELQAPARTEQTLHINLKKIKEFEGLNPLFFWATSGASLVTIGIGATLGILVLVRSGKFDDDISRRKYNEDVQGQIDDQALTADIFSIIGGVLAASSVLLFFMTDFGGDTEAPRAKGAHPDLIPVLEPGRAGLQLQGKF